MLNRLLIVFVYLVYSAPLANAASTKDEALRFDIPVVQGAEKYLEMLAYPAYLVAALENNGIKASNMGRPTLVDESTVQLKSAMLHFTEKKGAVYSYNGSLEWDIPLKHLKIDIPVEIDTSSASKGSIRVSVFLPLASFSPDALLDRIKLKVQTLSGPVVQKKMLDYFDEVSKKAKPNSGLQDMFAKIMLQSYALPVEQVQVCAVHEPGDAESLSDQAYLFATLAIWLIIVPGTIATYLYWRKRKNRNQE